MTIQLDEPALPAAGGTEPVLVARHLSKVYGDVLAVDDVSFEIARGEVVGLLGPNGAGKTSVIRMLSTTIAPSAGSFRVMGHDGRETAAIRRLIGVFPENSAAPGGFSGRAEIEYHARLYGHARDAARRLAGRLLEEVGLAEAADRHVSGYSRGMRQRLGIARALIGDPKVIFLDEPTLGLDPAGRRRVLDIILEISTRRGCAVVVSTHMLDEVERVSRRAIILDHGRVVAAGDIDDLRSRSGLPSLVHIRVDGDIRTTQRALASLPTVREVTGGSPRDDELSMTLHDAGDVMTVVAALADCGVRMRRFALEPARLEDVFLSLTGGER